MVVLRACGVGPKLAFVMVPALIVTLAVAALSSYRAGGLCQAQVLLDNPVLPKACIC